MSDEVADLEQERAARAAERIRRVSGPWRHTPEVSESQAKRRAVSIAAAARRVVEEWKRCAGGVPQPLSVAVMAMQTELAWASTAEEGNDDATGRG